MLLIQIFLIIFFLFALSRVILRYKKGELNIDSLIFWILFWLLASAVALIPNFSAYIAKIFGVGRGADLVVYISLSVLFFMIFKLNVKLEKMSKDITKIVQDKALDDKEL